MKKYNSTHYGLEIDNAVDFCNEPKASLITYDNTKTTEDYPSDSELADVENVQDAIDIIGRKGVSGIDLQTAETGNRLAIKKLAGETKYLNLPDNVKMVSITWSELKSMRDEGTLVKGMQYRITDYQCTTTQEDTQSAGNQFDIIVVADDESTINENARAIKHEGDTYFADCNLNAWELKYSIDNDTERFAWADETDGKGVIYWMKDELNNECPYDFKNIQYKKKVSVGDNGYAVFDEENGTETWLYTFTAYDMDNAAFIDAYIETNKGADGGSVLCDNNIKTNHTSETEVSYPKCQLNYNIFLLSFSIKISYYAECCNNTFGGDCWKNTFEGYSFSFNTLGNDCRANEFEGFIYNNIFGNICNGNTLKGTCFDNTFGSDCQANTFGKSCNLDVDCCYNTLGNYCSDNTFGDGCAANTFGDGCSYNTFGDECNDNTFGDGCASNKFGNECQENTFGNACQKNTFGNECQYNIFGNLCHYNTFGDECYGNTFDFLCASNKFGNGCTCNKFGNMCLTNTFGNSSTTKSYVRYITLDNEVQATYITTPATTSENLYLQNVHINSGVCGSSGSSRKTITIETAGNEFLTTIGNANDTKINI